MQANNGKIWGTISNGEIEIKTLTRADLEEALNILSENFFANESVCNACEINLPENAQPRFELRELCRLTAEDGISLVATDIASGKVIGVAFNKIQFIPAENELPFFQKFRDEQTQSIQAQALMNFMIEVDEKVDVFTMFQLNCLCELMFLGTLSKFEGKGIGRALGKHTIELTKQLSRGIGTEMLHPSLRNKRPRAVTALFTSQFSQKIGKALNFKVLNTVSYKDFSYNGKTFDQRINPMHQYCEHVIFLL